MAGHPGTAQVHDLVIEVRGLSMSYGIVDALCDIDLEVRSGEVLAFLGPNGAGKTTTVEILEGFRHRTAGFVCVLGVDPAKAGGERRSRVGVVLQESQPEPELTVEECVSLYAGYYPRPRPVGDTLELVGLADRSSVRCGASRGVSADGSTWPSPSSATRSCCSLTNRLRGSTRRPGAPPGRSSLDCVTSERPSS